MNPFLPVLAFFGILHVASGVVHRFEREAAADLASRLRGDGKRVTVRADIGPEVALGQVNRVTIEGSGFQTDRLPLVVEPKRSHRGELRELSFHLRNFDLGLLHVERLDADIPDCRFDFAAAVAHHVFRLSESGTGPVESEINQEYLGAFIRRKFPTLQNVRVAIDRDKVFVEGRGVFLMAPTDFWIVASLEPVGGTRLYFARARMMLNGRRVEPAAADRLVGLFNPVLDLNRDLGLANAVQITRLELRNGKMTTFGLVKIPPE